MAATTDDVVIRPVRRKDDEGVYALQLLPSILNGTLAVPSGCIEETHQRLISSGPDTHRFVAILDGQIVGMAGHHVGAGGGRHTPSLGMMVHDRFQGRGIDRKLLAALLDVADTYLGLARFRQHAPPVHGRRQDHQRHAEHRRLERRPRRRR